MKAVLNQKSRPPHPFCQFRESLFRSNTSAHEMSNQLDSKSTITKLTKADVKGKHDGCHTVMQRMRRILHRLSVYKNQNFRYVVK